MTMYRVAFNRDAKVAHIIGQGAELPEGAEDLGQFNASAVAPNPTDASIQHIHGMLYRAGVSDPSQITVTHEPVTDVIERRDQSTATEMGGSMAEVVVPATLELAVGEAVDILNGKPGKGTKFASADESIAKVSSKGTVTGVAAGGTTVTVTNEKDGSANEVVITVSEAAAPEGGEGNDS